MSDDISRTTRIRERMAKALNSLAYAPHEESWAKDKWPVFLPHVDAVLMAMHEPTEAMLQAGADHEPGCAVDCDLRGAWRLMIAAALKETQ